MGISLLSLPGISWSKRKPSLALLQHLSLPWLFPSHPGDADAGKSSHAAVPREQDGADKIPAEAGLALNYRYRVKTCFTHLG